jgi:hypothetical protein
MCGVIFNGSRGKNEECSIGRKEKRLIEWGMDSKKGGIRLIIRDFWVSREARGCSLYKSLPLKLNLIWLKKQA